MYALTFCYEACNGNTPFATPIAVSENRQKLVEKMRDCIEEDTQIDEDDEWNEDCNYKVITDYVDKVILQHRTLINLYTYYEIHSVEVL